MRFARLLHPFARLRALRRLRGYLGPVGAVGGVSRKAEFDLRLYLAGAARGRGYPTAGVASKRTLWQCNRELHH